MKAKLTEQVSNAKNLADDKEVTDIKTLVAIKNGKIHTPVVARWYMGRSAQASVVYCSIRINTKDFHTSGHGQAGGYGYHKVSAAFADALESAGIELYGSPYTNAVESTKERRRRAHIGGCGSSSVDAALKAIGRALGFRGQMEIV